MMRNHEERLIELETKYAYQEDTIQQLNRVVSNQQKQLDQLTVLLRDLHGRMQDLLSGGAQHLNEKPPHY